MELRPGERFDRYIIERQIAETRMSCVWLARDCEANRAAALKVIRRFEGNEDLIEAARFGAVLQQMLAEREQRVVKVYRYGDADGHFFIDMEYVDGRDVSQIISERGRIAPDQAVRVALEVAETLDDLHTFSAAIDGRQVVSAVHGDLKPKNIRIAGDLNGACVVKVLDFGTAKALCQTKPGGTRTPAWSPAYASPELLETREMNPLSDRWALGVSLYEMVTGHIPFGAGKSVEELENQIRHRSRMPDLDVPDCPAALQAILHKLLEPKPERRYQTARELCLDLRNYPNMPQAPGYQGETIRSEAPSTPSPAETRRSNAPARTTPPAPIVRRQSAPKSPRERAIRGALVIVFTLLFCWGGIREVQALKSTRQLETQLSSGRLPVSDASERLQELRSRPLVWIPTHETVRLLNAGFIQEGDAIVTRFRTTGIHQADWKKARAYFEQAQENDPKDNAIRGRLRLCDGHLKRFQAQSEKDAAALKASADNFREAARLLRDSPDPWLGLAMVVLYHQRDPEEGEKALEEARRRSFNYSAEGRWASLLADVYRLRADALGWEAQRIARTLPDQARQRLERAAAFYQKAIDWYTKFPLFGHALRDIERCRQALKDTNQRMETLRSQPAGQQ